MEKENMNWTDPKPPTEGLSYYDHVIMETPLGRVFIEWKSWKDRPSYDVEINSNWIGCGYSLDEAKEIAITHIKNKYNELKNFLYPSPPKTNKT